MDKLDIKILYYIKYSNNPLTTSEIAKLLFNINNNYELRKKDSYIREKIKKFLKRGVIVECNDGISKKKRYKLASQDSVLFGIGELKITNKSENIKLKIPLGEIVLIKEKDNVVKIEII